MHAYDLLVALLGRPRERRLITKAVTFAIAMAVPTLSSHLTLSQLYPLWNAVTLLAIGANLAVWYGVSLENEHNPDEVKHTGWRVVVAFLLVETWSGWALWQVDTAINDKKDAQISALQAHDEPRNLTPDQQSDISQRLAKWAKRSPKNPQVAVIYAAPLHESLVLAKEISAAIGPKGAGWGATDPAPEAPYSLTGVGVWVNIDRRSADAGTALAKALNDEGIYAFVLDTKRDACHGPVWDKVRDNPYCTEIMVIVGDHP